MSQAISKCEKKRVQDRNAQRAARQRTKDRLALLELQVSQLQGGADKALSDELEQMRKERNELRTMADHLMAIADESANAGLIPHIFRDYEALRTIGSPLSPLSDTHVILNGILNGWNGSVSDEEEPIQRLMAHLHRRFMLERPLARPIDQLAVLYLVQMSFLMSFIATYYVDSSCQSVLARSARRSPVVDISDSRLATSNVKIPQNISIDMLPWPQLRVHLLSIQLETAVSTHTEPCETFVVDAFRNLYLSPQINFQDAYKIGLDCRLAVSPQFQQHFAPTSVSCPFAVDLEFLSQYPDLRGLIPEYKDLGKAINRSHGGFLSISHLQSLSPLSQPGLLQAAAITASNDKTNCLLPTNQLFSHESKQSTNRDEVSRLSPHGSHDRITHLSQTIDTPDNINQRQTSPLLTDPTIGAFSSELSNYWHESVDLLVDDPGATWLLSSSVPADQSNLEFGSVEPSVFDQL
ncbi:hypothetical protein BO78DRAFT_423272 [Aspergillus sclerotiicarbonarius CBS 121057]|uniref:BZIP domain-containing protein n=1 Tax=Aspergillus sclerotiicarbonarius (strain CBS 121057 / IBT 28362) TaxID=1448318 RepID=A0A319DWN3_ASPSB|nr:hypothetical protein BO78DRAFT_423272 [Aspergillus sclerotiicarbonarius CBS 121057]